MNTSSPPGPVRVLCVDDNRDAADTTAVLLGLLGCQARSYYSPRSALAGADEFEPHACLIDLNMPGMNGDELAGRFREQSGGRPLLLVCVTAHGDPETIARVREAGFHLHLVKPVAPTDLATVVRGLEYACAVRAARSAALGQDQPVAGFAAAGRV